jgi:CheY-like chemotaxis protein
VVAWDTGSAHEAWSRFVEQPADAVLVDFHPGGPVDGLEVSRMLTTRDRGLKVVLMSGLVDEQRLAEAPRVGVVGFLPRELAAGDMVEALVGLIRPRRGGAGGPSCWRSTDQYGTCRGGDRSAELRRQNQSDCRGQYLIWNHRSRKMVNSDH